MKFVFSLFYKYCSFFRFYLNIPDEVLRRGQISWKSEQKSRKYSIERNVQIVVRKNAVIQ